MTIAVIEPPDVSDMRRVLALAEDRIGQYPEFRAFFERTFELDRIGLSRPGYVRAPSTRIYELVFVGRSGEPFPSAVEIHALVPALEPLEDEVIDRDLWALLRWMVAGVGPPWTLEALDANGRLYRLPAANDG